MSRARTARALMGAAAAGVGALLSRRRSADDDEDATPPPAAAPGGPAAAPPAAAATGDDTVMTYSSPGQVAAYEDVHGGGANWAATGGMAPSSGQLGADGEPAPPPAGTPEP